MRRGSPEFYLPHPVVCCNRAFRFEMLIEFARLVPTSYWGYEGDVSQTISFSLAVFQSRLILHQIRVLAAERHRLGSVGRASTLFVVETKHRGRCQKSGLSAYGKESSQQFMYRRSYASHSSVAAGHPCG